MPALKLGFKGKLYYDSASSWSSPTWALIDVAKDVSVPIEDEEIELDSRLSEFVLIAQGMRKFGIEFNAIYDPTNAAIKALMAAMWNRTDFGIAALDGLISDSTSRGWRQVGRVLTLNKEEKLKEGQLMTFSVKPTLQSTQHDPIPVKSDGTNMISWDFS